MAQRRNPETIALPNSLVKQLMADAIAWRVLMALREKGVIHVASV